MICSMRSSSMIVASGGVNDGCCVGAIRFTPPRLPCVTGAPHPTTKQCARPEGRTHCRMTRRLPNYRTRPADAPLYLPARLPTRLAIALVTLTTLCNGLRLALLVLRERTTDVVRLREPP